MGGSKKRFLFPFPLGGGEFFFTLCFQGVKLYFSQKVGENVFLCSFILRLCECKTKICLYCDTQRCLLSKISNEDTYTRGHISYSYCTILSPSRLQRPLKVSIAARHLYNNVSWMVDSFSLNAIFSNLSPPPDNTSYLCVSGKQCWQPYKCRFPSLSWNRKYVSRLCSLWQCFDGVVTYSAEVW